eukprot:4766265-Pyramimonas_sp.AAC.1
MELVPDQRDALNKVMNDCCARTSLAKVKVVNPNPLTGSHFGSAQRAHDVVRETATETNPVPQALHDATCGLKWLR